MSYLTRWPLPRYAGKVGMYVGKVGRYVCM